MKKRHIETVSLDRKKNRKQTNEKRKKKKKWNHMCCNTWLFTQWIIVRSEFCRFMIKSNSFVGLWFRFYCFGMKLNWCMRLAINWCQTATSPHIRPALEPLEFFTFCVWCVALIFELEFKSKAGRLWQCCTITIRDSSDETYNTQKQAEINTYIFGLTQKPYKTIEQKKN